MGCEMWVGMSVRIVSNHLSKLLYFYILRGGLVRLEASVCCSVLYPSRHGPESGCHFDIIDVNSVDSHRLAIYLYSTHTSL